MTGPLTILGYTPIEARIDIQCNLWYASQRCNPDHDTHKDALLVSIQGPSLAAAGLNALGIGGCAWAEPILHGSALAFLILGTLFPEESPFSLPDIIIPHDLLSVNI